MNLSIAVVPYVISYQNKFEIQQSEKIMETVF